MAALLQVRPRQEARSQLLAWAQPPAQAEVRWLAEVEWLVPMSLCLGKPWARCEWAELQLELWKIELVRPGSQCSSETIFSMVR